MALYDPAFYAPEDMADAETYARKAEYQKANIVQREDGTDVWTTVWYDEDAQWWEGWHSAQPFQTWYASSEEDWSLIGYELWEHGPDSADDGDDGDILEGYYTEPNPSGPLDWPEELLALKGMAQTGHWHVTRAGIMEDGPKMTFSPETLRWYEQCAVIKGKSEGKGWGKAFGKNTLALIQQKKSEGRVPDPLPILPHLLKRKGTKAKMLRKGKGQ